MYWVLVIEGLEFTVELKGLVGARSVQKIRSKTNELIGI